MSPRRREPEPCEPDLFSVSPSAAVAYAAEGQSWPDQRRFPVNRSASSTSVRKSVHSDLLASPNPLVVAGYSSIAEMIDFFGQWDPVHAGSGDFSVRILLGVEPYVSNRTSYANARAQFTDVTRAYWEERRVNVRLSAALLIAIAAIDDGRLRARFLHGPAVLHAKVYVGANAATVGSSNFTDAGLAKQWEANARFERSTEPRRYAELAQIGENLWALGEDWDTELRALLERLLRFVGWREALAVAAADLLEGEWAKRYVDAAVGSGSSLWPSQRSGIAQALWIIDNVGSVLVADATGSGKTRMGAHLVRAVTDRLWSTGRERRRRNVVVCPPPVIRTWEREALDSGVNISPVSHGLLSNPSGETGERAVQDVKQAQVLAIDETHNFLNVAAQRTQIVRENSADHVLLFTATPINRGPADLLQVVGLLGADNFSDSTVEALRRLHKSRALLSRQDTERLRVEIQGFTVRRTKGVLNALVDREPGAYLDPQTERVARYPRHDARVYDTGESDEDSAVADEIRGVTSTFVGIAQVERKIAVPATLRREYSDERWLSLRLRSVRGLAAHHVLSAMRSSQAALIEHLAGTDEVRHRFDLRVFKADGTGDAIAKLERRAEEEPPETELTGVELPPWLQSYDAWRDECLRERDRYSRVLELATSLSDRRERRKADLLSELLDRHDRVLAFDRHPVTLEVLRGLLGEAGVEVIVATGASIGERQKVEQRFAPASTDRAIALCSDAMNEGLNLQGASAVVHLDLPTTLRVAEQRIGRVDRMNSPYDAIEALWPRDGRSFATRANELLAQRAAESEQLLGSNLQVPSLRALDADQVVDVEERIQEAESPEAQTWDGIRDALQPVRDLVTGERALIDADIYDAARGAPRTTIVSAVTADTPWAFLAVTGGTQGAPRWMFIRGATRTPTVGLDAVAELLREHLSGEPPDVKVEDALDSLDAALDAGTRADHLLLPRRAQRALEQLARTCRAYATVAQRSGGEDAATRWRHLASFGDASRTEQRPDPYLVADAWRDLVRPHLDAERHRKRKQAFVLLREIDDRLKKEPLQLDEVEARLLALPAQAPFDERVVACILGVPSAPGAQESRPTTERVVSRSS